MHPGPGPPPRPKTLASTSNPTVKRFIPFLVALAAGPPIAHAQDTPPPRLRAIELQRSGSLADAATLWREVLDEAPGDAVAWLQLGHCLHGSGQWQEAAEAHRVVSGFPGYGSRGLYNLACAQALLARTELAFGSLESAIAKGFDNAALARTDPDLESLRGDPRWSPILESIPGPWPRRLRFWVGEWDCYSVSTGALNGRNTLHSRAGGAAIHEQWVPEGGGLGGESWNYFDPNTRTWRQHWVDGATTPFVYVGTPKGKGVLFEGPHLDSGSNPNRQRMYIRPIEHGRVRQTGSQSTDNGASWSPTFDLIYVPRGEPYEWKAGSVAHPTDRVGSPGPHQFDFLIGDWRMDVEQIGPGGEVVRRLTEGSRVRPRIGGAALVDEWTGSGFTVRTWDPKAGVWRLFWTDNANVAGRMQCWEGTFEGGVGTFLGGQGLPRVGPATLTSKIQFSEITEDSLLWKMWRSADNGETWVLDYVRRYQRLGD